MVGYVRFKDFWYTKIDQSQKCMYVIFFSFLKMNNNYPFILATRALLCIHLLALIFQENIRLLYIEQSSDSYDVIGHTRFFRIQMNKESQFAGRSYKI